VCSDPAGNFVVVWNGNSNEGFRIFGRRYSSLGIPLRDEFEISVNPQVALQPIPPLHERRPPKLFAKAISVGSESLGKHISCPKMSAV
jgi:hypothetical protein